MEAHRDLPLPLLRVRLLVGIGRGIQLHREASVGTDRNAREVLHFYGDLPERPKGLPC